MSMLPHDPYSLLLDELNEINDISTDEDIKKILQYTQKYVTLLRKGYTQSPAEVDYSDTHQRAAYLLAYYPHYIENVYHALNHLPRAVVSKVFNNSKMKACFFGAGPAPEVLGWIFSIRAFAPSTKRALAYLFDKNHWDVGQILTSYLAPHYWNGKLRLFPIKWDLDKEREKLAEWNAITSAISKSHLFIMQNCLNDQIGNHLEFIDTFLSLYSYTQPDTLFLIIDLKYEPVQSLMSSIEHYVQQNQLGEVLYSVNNGITNFRSQIHVPEIIYSELLTGDPELRLIPRKNTQFYLTALRRITDDYAPPPQELDDIPF